MKKQEEINRLMLMLAMITEPRKLRGRRHRLVDILFIALAAMVAGADDAEAIEAFGEYHEKWFHEVLNLEHGIPSQDTFLRLFAAIDPAVFQTVFRNWVDTALRKTHGSGHIALDGKTLRRTFDDATGKKAIHMVSAWLCEENLVLGQIAVGEKSNEITAIPELFALTRSLPRAGEKQD
jgi:DDE_Tnp_1-associated